MGVARGDGSTAVRALGAVVVIMVLALTAGCGTLWSELVPPTAGAPAAAGHRPAPTPSVGTPPAVLPDVLPDIAVINLPVGGRSRYVDATKSLQCVAVHWSAKATGAAGLPAGFGVRVTSISYDHYVFTLSRRGCESVGPVCVGYTFTATSGRPACSIALRTRWPLVTTLDDRRVALGGLLSCPESAGVARCRRSAAAIVDRRQTISVSTPHRRTPGPG